MIDPLDLPCLWFKHTLAKKCEKLIEAHIGLLD